MECPHLKQITKINNPFIKEGLILTNFECSGKILFLLKIICQNLLFFHNE